MSDDYEARFLHQKQINVGAWEIKKPGVEKPFTVLIYNYSEFGDLPLFTDLFVCKEWDPERSEVASQDILFLRHLWRELGLKEKMNGEEFSPHHINLWPERPDMVYRRDGDEVILRIPFVHRDSPEEVFKKKFAPRIIGIVPTPPEVIKAIEERNKNYVPT